MPSEKRKFGFGEIALLALALVVLLPIVLIGTTALKPDSEIVKFQSLLPAHPTLSNFGRVLGTPEEFPVFRWFFNSVFVSSMTTLLVLTVSSLAAYGLARLNLPGKRWVFAMILGTMMVPGQILLVPVYLLLSRLGWLDTYLALIIPAGAGAFGVFLLHQFFLAIPKELEEAAQIDGSSRLQTFWHVMVPLARPALATLGIFTFIGSWNDFWGRSSFWIPAKNTRFPLASPFSKRRTTPNTPSRSPRALSAPCPSSSCFSCCKSTSSRASP